MSKMSMSIPSRLFAECRYERSRGRKRAAAYLCLVDGCSKSLGSCSLEAESRAVTGRPVVAERGSACSGD